MNDFLLRISQDSDTRIWTNYNYGKNTPKERHKKEKNAVNNEQNHKA